MRKSTINFDTVRNIGLALPGVEESTAYAAPALKVRGKLWHACLPIARLSRIRAVEADTHLRLALTSTTAPNYSQPLPMFTT
jgi:hypothetical protein